MGTLKVLKHANTLTHYDSKNNDKYANGFSNFTHGENIQYQHFTFSNCENVFKDDLLFSPKGKQITKRNPVGELPGLRSPDHSTFEGGK